MWSDRLVHALGWSLLHSLWQIGVIALGAAAVLALLRRRGPVARYLVAYGALLLMVVLPCLTAYTLATTPASAPAATAAPAAWTAAAAETAAETAAPAADLQRPLAALAAGAGYWIDPLLPWMVACWLLGVAASATRLAGGYVQVRRLRRRGVLAVPERWQRSFGELAARLGIRRPVRLVASARLLVPAACGWLRPMVIVPVGVLTGLPPAQVESILAHELAHVRRHDYLLNLVQSVAEMLLFYHPAVWWLSARIRVERENCCDDLAVAVCGDARTYVKALAGIEALRAAPVPAPALAASGGSLLGRIRRLLAPPTAAAGEAGPRMAAAGVLGAALVVACLALVVRADVPGTAAAPAGDPGTLVSTAFSYQDELQVEGTCDQWERPRRCVDDAGHGRFECAVKSPMAAVLRALHGGGTEDAEVRMERVRVEPVPRAQQAAAAGPGAAGAESVARGVDRTTTGVEVPSERVREQVLRAELPSCRTSRVPGER